LNGQEKRKYKRYENLPIDPPVKARFQVRSDVQEMGPDDWNSVILMNLSAGGAFFYSKKDLGIGTLLDFKIDMPKPAPTINCTGKIIRSDELQSTSVFCIAIKFVDIGEQEKKLINKMAGGILE
jgi:hypothetical protein